MKTTGQIIGLKKRYKADKLQRSYGSFADQFGFTKRQVKDALKYLESLGIIDLDLRHITIKDGRTIPNVLFIGLDPVALRRITYNQREICDDKTEDTPRYSVGNGTPEGHTNTETTTENTTEITTEKKDSIFPENPEPVPPSPDPGDADSGKETDDDDSGHSGHSGVGDPGIATGGSDHAVGDPQSESEIAPDMWDLARRTAAARAEAGNFAVSAQAGGSFALADRLITAACARLGRSEPQGKKRDNAVGFFKKALRDEGLLQGDVDMLEHAVKDWLDPEGEYAFFLPQYDLNPKHELALRHFGIMLSKAKKQTAVKPDRRARDVEAMEASVAALEERRADRSPLVDLPNQTPWNLTLDTLWTHVGEGTFNAYYRDTRLLSLDDGTAVVQARDGPMRDFLQNRAEVIGRELGRVLGRAVEVRVEVGE
jgi:hypothetical protein